MRDCIARSSGREMNLRELLVLGSWGCINLMGLLVCRGTVHRALFREGEEPENMPVVTRGHFPWAVVCPLPRCCGAGVIFSSLSVVASSPHPAPCSLCCDLGTPLFALTTGRRSAAVANLPRLLDTNPHCPWQGKSLPVIHLASKKGFFFLRAAELFEIRAMFSDTKWEYTSVDRKCCLITQDGSLFLQSMEFQSVWKPEMWLWTHYFDFLLAAST